MLFKVAELEAIRAGRVDIAFRRWARPTVKAGGSLTTAIGVLAILSVDPIETEDITDEDARRAGFADSASVLNALAGREGQVYRIGFRFAGDDPRLALRQSEAGLDEVRAALKRLDAKAAWTGEVLDLIAENPGVSAQILADGLGLEKLKFKARVRQLKALGLTESLEVGYRLSPRGQALRRG